MPAFVCNNSASWPWHIFSRFMMRCSVCLCYCRVEAKDNPGTVHGSGIRCLSVWPPWHLSVSSSLWDLFWTVLTAFKGPHLSALCYCHTDGNLDPQYLNSVMWVWRYSDKLLAPKCCLCWQICSSTKQERAITHFCLPIGQIWLEYLRQPQISFPRISRKVIIFLFFY